jgi:hypothetical protein
MTPARALRRWRQARRARTSLDFVNLLVLCLLTVTFLVLGFSFRPAASGPAQIPSPPMLTIGFTGPQAPQDLAVYSYLVQSTGSQASLIMDATANSGPEQRAIPWTVTVQGFTGYLCTPRPNQARLTRLGNSDDYTIMGTAQIPATPGEPFLVLYLCWHSGPPLEITGSYLSAALPPILVTPGGGTLTRGLKLTGTSLSAYTLAGGVAPTKVTPASWAWTSPLSGDLESQASAEIPVIASSIPGIQRDSANAFYSGIFFGIAGGAAVSVIPAYLEVAKRKAERKPPASERTAQPSDPLPGPGEPDHD